MKPVVSRLKYGVQEFGNGLEKKKKEQLSL